jgi:ribosome-binding protein aMBF1 (putative translation factor)
MTNPQIATRKAMLGDIVLEARLDAGFSARQLAARAGVKRSVVLDIEQGKMEPSEAILRALMEAMGIQG